MRHPVRTEQPSERLPSYFTTFPREMQAVFVRLFQNGKDNIKCERKRKPPDALFFYLKSTEREVRTCETTDI